MSAPTTSRTLALAMLAVAACAHERVHHGEWVDKLRFEGNHKLGGDTLKTGLALHRVQKRGGVLDPYLVQVDEDRIRGEYLRHGYLDVDVRARVERQGDAATVTYTIEEGVRASTRVVIAGLPNDPDLPVHKVRELLPLKDGQPFDYEPYDKAKPMLLGVIQDAGYAHAKLDANVVADRANHSATIQLTYTPGPKCKFGNVVISGVSGELEQAVRERITFSPGQQYSTQAISASQRNLYGMQRFSTVRVQPDLTDGEVVGVHVSVAESARHEVRLGGGFGVDPTAYEVRGRAGYTIAGWPWPLDTVTLDFRPAYARLRETGEYEPRMRAVAKLDRADLFWTYTTSTIETGYNYLAVEAYTSYGPHALLSFTTPIVTNDIKLQVGWGLEQVSFRNINPLIDPALQMQIGVDHSQRIGAYRQALVLDLRDHPIEPTFGAYGEIKVNEGTKYAGGSLDFVELVPELRGYLPVIDGVILAARARTGRFWGDVPTTERFFSGGATSQRGFSERRLAPSVTGEVDGNTQTVPYGGGGMIETSVEARVPLMTIKKMPLGAVVFLDGGDVTERPSQLDLGNLHWAVGGGLRLHTIVGPVRFDVGYRLNRTGPMDPDPGSHYAFHLTIGEAF